MLKANKTTETTGSILLRKALVTVQFSVSVFLIITTTIVYGQLLFATTTDPGFNKDKLLTVYNIGRSEIATSQQQALKEQIARLPGVTNTALGSGRPYSGGVNKTGIGVIDRPDLGNFAIGMQSIGYDFLTTYQIPLLAGRNYSRDFATDGTPAVPENHDGSVLEGTVIVNQSAISAFGYDSPEATIGRSIRTIVGGVPGNFIYANLTIIGVIPDIHLRSLHKVIEPEAYLLNSPWFRYQVLTVRFNGDPTALIQQIKGIWAEMFPDIPFAHGCVDELMLAEFKKEQNLATILGVFSLLAVAIAGLGLYGLASFTAERRTKEIGIRKVLGANIVDIVRLLIWQFSKPVLIAILIASPIAAWAMIRWLETFPYRLDSWVLLPVCLMAAVIAFVTAWATVGGNTAKVARENPIKALRYE